MTLDLLIWKKLFPAWTGASVIYLGSKWQHDVDGKVRGSVSRYPSGGQRAALLHSQSIYYECCCTGSRAMNSNRLAHTRQEKLWHGTITWSTWVLEPWPPERLSSCPTAGSILETHSLEILLHVNHIVFLTVTWPTYTTIRWMYANTKHIITVLLDQGKPSCSVGMF